jgi:hypothetical protein
VAAAQVVDDQGDDLALLGRELLPQPTDLVRVEQDALDRGDPVGLARHPRRGRQRDRVPLQMVDAQRVQALAQVLGHRHPFITGS